jgi:hypothetical protein
MFLLFRGDEVEVEVDVDVEVELLSSAGMASQSLNELRTDIPISAIKAYLNSRRFILVVEKE